MNFNIFKILVLVYATATFFTCTESASDADNARAEFFVKGNCNRCKERIERAAMNITGVKTADWNKETKMLTVNYDSVRTDFGKLDKAVTAAGHEITQGKSSGKADEHFPSCCKKM